MWYDSVFVAVCINFQFKCSQQSTFIFQIGYQTSKCYISRDKEQGIPCAIPSLLEEDEGGIGASNSIKWYESERKLVNLLE